VWKPYPTKFDQPKNEKKNTNQKVLDSTSDEQY
jgi:hypothetical protein